MDPAKPPNKNAPLYRDFEKGYRAGYDPEARIYCPAAVRYPFAWLAGLMQAKADREQKYYWQLGFASILRIAQFEAEQKEKARLKREARRRKRDRQQSQDGTTPG